MAGGWQYLLFRLNGNGTETFIRGDVPLSGVSASKVLSGPHQITGKLDVPIQDLQLPDGSPLLRRWQTTLYVQDPNQEIWCGGILVDYTIDGPSLNLDVSGFTTAAKGQPFDAEINSHNVDPLDAVRAIWAHLQGKPGGNLGLAVDQLTTPVKLGVPDPADTSTDTAQTESVAITGTFKMNWWSTFDAGNDIDTMAKDTPFDYCERHYWDGDVPRHRLEFGYPKIGSRKTDLRFVLNENVYKIPTETYAEDDVVTEVWVMGAGEGRSRIRGVAAVAPNDSIRRVKIIDDKTITIKAIADQRASEELRNYQPEMPGGGVTELLVRNHGNAPLGSYDVGDEILYSADHDWGDIAIWVTITKMTINPDESDDLAISVIRTDTLNA